MPMTEVEVLRDLVRDYWAGRPVLCSKHHVPMTGSFVQTTFADHVFLVCPRGKETITIPQRPKQLEFQPQQVEGFVENIQRGDKNLCYRCQSPLEVAKSEDAATGRANFTFTCVRCFSFGRWNGHPELAKIGSSPTAGTAKKGKAG